MGRLSFECKQWRRRWQLGWERQRRRWCQCGQGCSIAGRKLHAGTLPRRPEDREDPRSCCEPMTAVKWSWERISKWICKISPLRYLSVDDTVEEALWVAVGRGRININVVKSSALGLCRLVSGSASPAEGYDQNGGEELHGQRFFFADVHASSWEHWSASRHK